MCRCAYPQEILIQCYFVFILYFLGVMPIFEQRNLTKMKDTTQNNSTEIAQQNVVVMKDMCRYAFLQEMLI